MNTHHQHGRTVKSAKHTGRWILAAVISVPLVLLAVIAIGLSQISTSTPQPPQAKSHFMDKNEMRSVKVAVKSEPMIMDEGGSTVAVVTLLEGTVPAGDTKATVKTDENCAPDQGGKTPGWSHCHNRVVFENGAEAVIQHHHKLAEVGCFTPGQVIMLVA